MSVIKNEEILIKKLNDEYGIDCVGIRFLSMNDHIYAYRIKSQDGQYYFLKIFTQNSRTRSKTDHLQLTFHLYSAGLFRNLSHPIPSSSGEFVVIFDQFTLVLYNFIEGRTLADSYPFTPQIVQNIARTMASIHNVTSFLIKDGIFRESFDNDFVSEIMDYITLLESDYSKQSGYIKKLSDLILPRKTEITKFISMFHQLEMYAKTTPKQEVLCHGDIWGGNTINHHGTYFIIDWESSCIAPPERDLFHYVGQEFQYFLQAYLIDVNQSFRIDVNLLRFYTYRRYLSMLPNSIKNLLYHDQTDQQKEWSLEVIDFHCMQRWAGLDLQFAEAEKVIKSLSSDVI